jgi:RNA polymerase sigma-70 factor (ECF subfamily)
MVKDKNSERPVQNLATQPVEPSAAPDMEQIFRAHASRVLSAAYRVTGSQPDAEDVLQTVFLRLVRRERGAHLEGNPAAYLHRAAINAAVDLVRSRRVSRATPFEDAAVSLAAPESGDADRKLASGELRNEVRKALAELSPRAAEIFTLRYFEGYDNHEIARMQGSSRSTVAVILHRARQRVREAIGPYVGSVGDES